MVAVGRGRPLQVFQESIVVGVRADPKPYDGVAVESSDGAAADADADGIYGRNVMHSLEMQAGVGRGRPRHGERAGTLGSLDVGRDAAARRKAGETVASCETS